MENLTEVDENWLEDPSTVEEIKTTYENVRDSWVMITLLLKFALCLVNISASIFLMVIIMRFKKLRTRTNMYLFHYALNNALYYLAEPILFVTVLVVDINYEKTLFCCLGEFDDSCLILMFVFAIAFVLDYYTIRLRTRLLFLYKNMYNYVIFVLYNIGSIKFLLSIIICFSDNVHFRHHVLAITYVIILVIINVINVIEHRDRKQTKQERIRYPLIVANFVVYAWFPIFLYDVVEVFLPAVRDNSVRIFITFTEFIPQFLAHSHAIVVVYILGRLDKHFKMAYTIALKRRFRNYEHNDLDQSEDESVVQHQVNGCKTQCDSSETVDTEEAFADIVLR